MKYFWRNSQEGKVYLHPFDQGNFGFIADQNIVEIQTVITYLNNGEYGPVIYKGQGSKCENLILNCKGKTVTQFLIYLAKCEINLAEYDLIFTGGIRIRTFYGNDVIIESPVGPSGEIHNLLNSFLGGENVVADGYLYKMTENSIERISKVEDIELFLLENEYVFFD